MDSPTPKAIRVLIADDQPAARAGIRRALDTDRFEICDEVDNAGAAVVCARRERPDLCLIGTRVDGGGIAAARRIRQLVPATTIVMLAAKLDENELFEALHAGCDGYLLEDTDPSRLPFILAGAVAGEAALPRKLAARVIEEFRGRERGRRVLASHGRAAALTAREWEILEVLRERASTAEIASRLAVSPVTVRRHVSEIVRKLGVADREAAVRLVETARDVRGAVRSNPAA